MDSIDLTTLNLVLRSALVGLLLFAAAMLVRDRAGSLTARLAAAFALGVAAYALLGMPGVASPGRAWLAPVVALSAGNAAVFWIFSRALFDDDFVPRWWHGAAWLALAAAALADCLVLGPARSPWAGAIGVGLDLATLGFALLALGQSLSSWRADLVEGRRRLRLFIVGAGAAYSVLLVGARLAPVHPLAPQAGGVVDALALLAIVVVIAWELLRVARWAPVVGDAAPPAATPAHASAAAPDPADDRLIAALRACMDEDHAYREEALTIGALAQRLSLPEYKLRRLINQRLGYRNFNAFLNRYRIEEARRALLDPARSDLPVLAIAMDVGFQSIGPFNRAFKAETGTTPSEFRRQRGCPAPAAAPLALADSEIG
ncbi:MAG TPA: helix-turn-helix domain-containing protein [Albitalea sp.]|nr:helix-turn-helix domain-containing protein [Albitalea sp.]